MTTHGVSLATLLVLADGTTFEVYNALGRKCAFRFERTSGQLIELDLSSLGQGMYIINVIKEGGMESHTVVIE